MSERRLPLKAKGERPFFFEDPSVDKLVAMIMGLAGELSVMHDKHDTLVRLIEGKGLLSAAEIEAYRPDAAATAAREAWRESMLENVLRIVHQEIEGLEREASAQPYQAALELVER